ncbi:DUF3048 domain-containing protein [Lederbergia sp. NSJ-179]|uniref:DUF3048 domain-containing protein n=1 Tax=Lederbergia sp. NSJ-179 TaxID=2931402 RepID=UPI001FD13520|nr:DUF3048 domain-containing protein [Lederbergia sp. NSJ-179]MCJ7840991.1 DUF3048 domain-containing protein [Lederbergia sp. NSJ-179]
MFYKRTVCILLLMSILTLVACNKKEEQPKPEEGDSPSKTEEKESPSSFVYPLTGMPTEKASNQRAIAVTVNNHMAARPQSGLSKADIVYELLAEGSITRFLAIFQSEVPERMGPVRSARDYYIDIAEGYHSLYIAHGYSPSAKKRLNAGEIDQLNGIKYDGTLFKRSSDRKAPHNSYISNENIEKGAKQEGYHLDELPSSLDFLTEEEVERLQGEQARQLQVAYSKNDQFVANYQYDQESETYTRESNGEQTIDLETDAPILLDNLVVIEAEHQVIDEKGRRSIDLTSGGKALLFQKGLVKEIEWEDSDGRPLPYEDGLPAKLVPGRTWISIVPSMEIVSYKE